MKFRTLLAGVLLMLSTLCPMQANQDIPDSALPIPVWPLPIRVLPAPVYIPLRLIDPLISPFFKKLMWPDNNIDLLVDTGPGYQTRDSNNWFLFRNTSFQTYEKRLFNSNGMLYSYTKTTQWWSPNYGYRTQTWYAQDVVNGVQPIPINSPPFIDTGWSWAQVFDPNWWGNSFEKRTRYIGNDPLNGTEAVVRITYTNWTVRPGPNCTRPTEVLCKWNGVDWAYGAWLDDFTTQKYPYASVCSHLFWPGYEQAVSHPHGPNYDVRWGYYILSDAVVKSGY